MVNGKMICKTEKESKLGHKEQSMKVNSSKEKNVVKENTNGQTGQYI
jgi:hypothetical protein